MVSIAMQMMNMQLFEDNPSSQVPEDSWIYSDQERREILSTLTHSIYNEFARCTYNREVKKIDDQVMEYQMNVLTIGLFYLEYRDAIKEGDGIRILRCWKYLLKIFFSTHRTNYTAEALTLLMQHSYILTERQSAQLLYGRFINTEGIPGRNIP